MKDIISFLSLFLVTSAFAQVTVRPAQAPMPKPKILTFTANVENRELYPTPRRLCDGASKAQIRVVGGLDKKYWDNNFRFKIRLGDNFITVNNRSGWINETFEVCANAAYMKVNVHIIEEDLVVATNDTFGDPDKKLYRKQLLLVPGSYVSFPLNPDSGEVSVSVVKPEDEDCSSEGPKAQFKDLAKIVVRYLPQ